MLQTHQMLSTEVYEVQNISISDLIKCITFYLPSVGVISETFEIFWLIAADNDGCMVLHKS